MDIEPLQHINLFSKSALRTRAASETSYTRGVTQGLQFAFDWFMAGGSLEEFAVICDISMEMRIQGRGGGAFLDKLRQEYRP